MIETVIIMITRVEINGFLTDAAFSTFSIFSLMPLGSEFSFFFIISGDVIRGTTL